MGQCYSVETEGFQQEYPDQLRWEPQVLEQALFQVYVVYLAVIFPSKIYDPNIMLLMLSAYTFTY